MSGPTGAASCRDFPNESNALAAMDAHSLPTSASSSVVHLLSFALDAANSELVVHEDLMIPLQPAFGPSVA